MSMLLMVTGAAASGWTSTGAGPLLSLSIEKFITSPTAVSFYYNMWCVLTLALIAFSAGQFDQRFIAILCPIWAAFCVFAGWFQPANVGNFIGIIVVCLMLAYLYYVMEVRHERFGLAGPGNLIVKIFTFVVILQCAVVFFNSTAIFPADAQYTVSNSQFMSIDFLNQTQDVTDSGGLTATLVNISTIILQITVSILLLVIKCLAAIAVFSLVINAVFPFIAASAYGAAFLVMLQFVVWTIYLWFIFTMYYKPGPDPNY